MNPDRNGSCCWSGICVMFRKCYRDVHIDETKLRAIQHLLSTITRNQMGMKPVDLQNRPTVFTFNIRIAEYLEIQ